MVMGNKLSEARLDSAANSSLLEQVELFRYNAAKANGKNRAELGQFMTPSSLAGFMARMFIISGIPIRLLDAGAGVGSLTAALVDEVCNLKKPPKELSVTAYEIDASLIPFLETTLKACQSRCKESGIKFSYVIINEDFIKAGVSALKEDLFSSPIGKFNFAILNPPYKKIQSSSEHRKLLSSIGIETSNLYTAFLAIIEKMMEKDGQLVAITPRSFCNGPYFKHFRHSFLNTMVLQRIHIFESRKTAFHDDEVLQENIIFHAVKSKAKPSKVVISSNAAPDDEPMTWQETEYEKVVQPNDPDSFIHIVTDEIGQQIAEKMKSFQTTLDDLGIAVSTGRVVDFRAEKFLRSNAGNNTVPLIYPCHFCNGFVQWPCSVNKKSNAIVSCSETQDLLIPSGFYVLVKRFSAKEEKRRVIAAIFDPGRVKSRLIGFENHLNYYHSNGNGLPENLAKGLAAFLNSMLVDSYFRLFNGHTQVNATDLRSFKYPTRKALEFLGSKIGKEFPSEDEIDNLMDEVMDMPEENGGKSQPVKAKKKTEAALKILKSLGMPRAQLNERSALTLLALLNVKPETAWRDADAPLIGITPIMDFITEHYGKKYAPNTRETVRRQTVHQFLDAGIIVINPDDPSRPTNSPKTVYRIEQNALELIRSYDSPQWNEKLREFLQSVETLKAKYAQEREGRRIPVKISSAITVHLSPGGQNRLVKRIMDLMLPNFAPGGKILYLGDTARKFAYFDRDALAKLGVTIEDHGKMPDVVIHHVKKNWLLLIEAVTSHGPVDPKRRGELKELFKGSKSGLVFVTAFLQRSDMVKYISQISWETEVWVAESPTHMIHFNGERFLGPYE
jgi:adenine-specific DNA-methyltransferase